MKLKLVNAAERGQLCVIEFASSSTYRNGQTVREVCYEPAKITSITQAGLVKAVERRRYGGKITDKVAHIFSYRCAHLVSLKILPKTRVSFVLDILERSPEYEKTWHTIEDAQTAVRRAIQEQVRRRDLPARVYMPFAGGSFAVVEPDGTIIAEGLSEADAKTLAAGA